MAKTPTRRGAPRRASGPANRSRGSGPAAPPSTAASEAFYRGDDDEPETQLMAHQAHIDRVRENAVDLGDDEDDDAGSADHDVAASLAGEEPADLDAPPSLAEIERIRKLRKPLGTLSQKLALPVRRGYHRHWFNDTGNRVAEAVANGWAYINDPDGKPIRRAVGTGRDNGVMFAIAMELPEVFWREDMEARNQIAVDKMEALRRSPIRAEKGKVDKSDAGKFYSPSEEVLSVEKR